MPVAPRPRSCRRGFTLVEMMAGLAVASLVVLAMLIMQRRLTQQNMRMTDAGALGGEVRAAFDAITRDLSGAGFLASGTQDNCRLTLNYNSGAPDSHYFSSDRVEAMRASPAAQLPFLDASATPAIAFNYPASGSAASSDILAIRATTSTTQFSDAALPSVRAGLVADAAPMTTGALPLGSTGGFKANDVALVQMPVGTPGAQRQLCVRVPVTSVAAGSGIASSGATMPPTFYAGFSAQLANFGFGDAVLSDALLQVAKVTDLGPPGLSNQRTFVYFVDQPAGSAWPRLTRLTLNSLTDTEVPGSRQDIASGVVSFQVSFGVDPAGTGGVTAYQTGAQVKAAGNGAAVRSVRFLLITRSLYADPSPDFAMGSAPAGQPYTLQVAGFADYVIAPSDRQYRHVVRQGEVALRNTLWADN